ncbi:MAG: class B sortase [Eubacteriales bacterium]|nr:class B sortase [Eubacteriales bacterium]
MKKIRSFALGILGAAAGLLLYCGSFYVRSYLENQQTQQAYEQIREACVSPEYAEDKAEADKEESNKEKSEKEKSGEQPKKAAPSKKAKKTEKEKEIEESFGIRWKELREINSQVVGWIEVPGADISYPAVQGNDDDYYLHHSITGEEDAFGTIFLGCVNNKDFSDSHSFLYGHNMEGNLMFANLNRYAEPEYLAQHPEFYIYTPERKLQYRIFSIERAGARSPGFVYGNALGSEEYKEQLAIIQELSLYDTGTETDADKSIVTLVTCTSRLEEDVRMLVHGICTESVDWTEQEESQKAE